MDETWLSGIEHGQSIVIPASSSITIAFVWLVTNDSVWVVVTGRLFIPTVYSSTVHLTIISVAGSIAQKSGT